MSLLSKSHIAKALRAVGVGRGDTAFVHADLKAFGLTKDARGRITLALAPETALAGFCEVLGERGTLIVPAFSYSWPKPGMFSLWETPSKMGALSEAVRLAPGAIRSEHPILSLAGIGPKASAILNDTDGSAFGPGSPYARLHELNAKLPMLGVPFCSFKDYVELAVKVPYRYTKRFSGLMDRGNGPRSGTCMHSVRYLSCDLDLVSLYEGLSPAECCVFREATLGPGRIRCSAAGDLFPRLRQKLENDPYAFVRRPPVQRAVLDRLSETLEDRAQPPFLSVVAWNDGDRERWSFRITDGAGEREVVVGDEAMSGADIVLNIANQCLGETGLAAFKTKFIEGISAC